MAQLSAAMEPRTMAAVAIRPDGSAMVACWPPIECPACHTAAAFGIVRMVERTRNVFACVGCAA